MDEYNNLLIVISALVLSILTVFLIKYYYESDVMREKFMTTGWVNIGNDRYISAAQYHEMANAPFIANSPWSTCQCLINDVDNTIANVPDELEPRKKNAMAKMNECYEIGLENDALNALQMRRGALLVLP
jgi:hypothetical protein